MPFIPATIPGPNAATLEAKFEELQKLASSLDKWKKNGEHHGVTMYIPNDGTAGARSDGHVNFPRRSLIDLLIRIECKNETDDMFEKGRAIERYGLTRKWPQRGPTPAQDCSHAQATLMQYRGVMLVSARDFVAASAWKVLEDGTLLVVAYSEPHAGMPEQKGVVRAELHIGGWVVKPTGGVAGEAAGGCDCTYLMLADLKGSVPDWLTKMVFSTQGAVVTKLKAALEKRFKGDAGAKALAEDKALPLVNLEEEEAAAAAAK